MTSLEHLDLSSNLIESIPDDLFDMNSSVVVLDLSDNALFDIGRFLLNVSLLRHLDLSRNFILEIRMPALINLVNLVYLDVSGNQLKGHVHIRLPPQLEEFLIDSNDVTHVEFQHTFLHLVRLTISSNLLTNLPRLFDAPQLALLNVSNNEISAITDVSFTCCKNLRKICLANNSLTTLSVGAFRGLFLLAEIDLSDNQLRYLSTGLFGSCSVLSVVNLSHNQLTAVDAGTFAGPTNLRALDMSWNKLTTLTINSVHEVFFTLVRLSLSGNPLHCDCQLTWLTQYSAVVEHNTTICCPQHDLRPAVCRHVACAGWHATCPSTSTTSVLPVDHSLLCARTVPLSVIEVVFQFQQHTTTPPLSHTTELTSTSNAVFNRSRTSLTNSFAVDDINDTTTAARSATASPASIADVNDADDSIIVIAVLIPLLAVSHARCHC